MKKVIEYIAVISVVFLMMTVDSYSTQTLGILAGVTIALFIIESIVKRRKRVNLAHFPRAKDSEQLEKWLRATIKKIDKMDDK